MSQGLIQVRIHSDNCSWAPKSRGPNSNKEREKIVSNKKRTNKKEKKTDRNGERRKEKKNGTNKNATESIDAQINKKRMYINIIERRKKMQKRNCILLLSFCPRSKSSAQ